MMGIGVIGRRWEKVVPYAVLISKGTILIDLPVMRSVPGARNSAIDS